MDLDALELEDQERLRALRQKLRAHVEEVLDDYLARPKPVTEAEVCRHFRTVALGERTLRQLYAPPQRRRPRAPKTAATPKPPKAPSEATMLSELKVISSLLDKTGLLYKTRLLDETSPLKSEPAPQPAAPTRPSPKPGPKLEAKPEPTPQQQLQATLDKMVDRIDQITRRYAQWAEIWPDGTPFSLDDANWRSHTDARPLDIDMDGDEAGHSAVVMLEILRRCNAIARQFARRVGFWFNTTPYRDGDPDYWTFSANLDSALSRPADDEDASPDCIPWWIVKKRPA